MDTLASRVEWARGVAGLSASALSKRAGLAQSHVGMIESGTRGGHGDIAYQTVRALAEALGVDTAWLMEGGKTPSKESIRRHVNEKGAA